MCLGFGEDLATVTLPVLLLGGLALPILDPSEALSGCVPGTPVTLGLWGQPF